VTDKFFDELEQVLVQYIGPVAPYIIEEILTDLGEDKYNFEDEKIPLLIEALSREITDDKKRVEFQKDMLERIRTL
jgi:leucyl-tRNA synthetase